MDIDPQELDRLSERFPGLPRSRVELALEAYGSDKEALETALEALSTAEAMRVLRKGQSPLT